MPGPRYRSRLLSPRKPLEQELVLEVPVLVLHHVSVVPPCGFGVVDGSSLAHVEKLTAHLLLPDRAPVDPVAHAAEPAGLHPGLRSIICFFFDQLQLVLDHGLLKIVPVGDSLRLVVLAQTHLTTALLRWAFCFPAPPRHRSASFFFFFFYEPSVSTYS